MTEFNVHSCLLYYFLVGWEVNCIAKSLPYGIYVIIINLIDIQIDIVSIRVYSSFGYLFTVFITIVQRIS